MSDTFNAYLADAGAFVSFISVLDLPTLEAAEAKAAADEVTMRQQHQEALDASQISSQKAQMVYDELRAVTASQALQDTADLAVGLNGSPEDRRGLAEAYGARIAHRNFLEKTREHYYKVVRPEMFLRTLHTAALLDDAACEVVSWAALRAGRDRFIAGQRLREIDNADVFDPRVGKTGALLAEANRLSFRSANAWAAYYNQVATKGKK